MSKTFNTNIENKDEWLTPPYISKALGEFDLDPCQPIIPPFVHARKGYNILDDGLVQSWGGGASGAIRLTVGKHSLG